MGDIPKQLLDILEQLSSEDLKKFQFYLINGVEGFTPIPKGLLENCDRYDTVNKMMQKYGPDQAVEITLATLRKMENNQLAEKLSSEIKNTQPGPGQNTSDQPGPNRNTSDQPGPSRNTSAQYGRVYNITAHSGGTNNMPFIGENVINGPFNINYPTGPKPESK